MQRRRFRPPARSHWIALVARPVALSAAIEEGGNSVAADRCPGCTVTPGATHAVVDDDGYRCTPAASRILSAMARAEISASSGNKTALSAPPVFDRSIAAFATTHPLRVAGDDQTQTLAHNLGGFLQDQFSEGAGLFPYLVPAFELQRMGGHLLGLLVGLRILRLSFERSQPHRRL